MDVGRRGGLWFLIPVLLASLFFVGLYRVVEVVASLALGAAGSPDPTAAAVKAIAVVAVIAGMLGYAWWRARREQRRWMSVGLMHADDTEPTPQHLRDIAEARQHLAYERSPLRRVVAIGRTIAADGLTIDAIALEIREAAGRLTLVIHDPVGGEQQRDFESRMREVRERATDEWPMFLRTIVRLADDIGTRYVTWEAGGGGSEGVIRHDIGFVPPVPEAATALTITIDRLTTEPEFPMPVGKREPRVIEGPWHIEVPLASQR